MLKNPYLLQRCKAKEFSPEMTSSEYISFDYMGASEFEWGALPKWQRDVEAKLNRMIIREMNHGGHRLFVLAEADQVEDYIAKLKDVIDRVSATKCRVGLDEKEVRYCSKNGKRKQIYHGDPSLPFEYNLWWDITNTLAFARSQEILENLKVTVGNSVRKMNSRK